MDIANLSFVGLATLGAVNVMTFFKKDMDSKLKFGFSIVFAFLLTFIPAELGSILLEKSKLAIETAFAVSGGYKLVTKMGGN